MPRILVLLPVFFFFTLTSPAPAMGPGMDQRQLIEMPDRMVDLLFRFLRQNEGRLSERAREREFAELNADEASRVERIYDEELGPPPEIRSMSDLDIALHNREVMWPLVCEKAADGIHRIGMVKPMPSKIHEGWTYQGVCGLCGEMVDTGEPADSLE